MAKGVIVGKWSLKSGSSRPESDVEKNKQENAALRKALEKVTEGKGRAADPEHSRLLEKILCLEKEKEKYNHLLGEKDKEIQNLRDRLKSKKKSSEVSSLYSQLEEKTKEAERRERLICSLSEEINQLKCDVFTITAKCSEIENRTGDSQASQEAVMSSPGSSTNLSEVEKQLKDALEKNQQWLLYDQQREAYVRGLLGRIFELEQRSEVVSQQQPKESNGEGHAQEENQRRYDQLLQNAKDDLEAERRNVAQLKCQLNELKKFEQRQQEIMSLSASLQSQQVAEMEDLKNENKIKGEKIQILKQENDSIKIQLREEKRKCEDLSSQVQLLCKSLLKQQEGHNRIALLEQKIQVCTTDLENEKLDRQNLKHQLNKTLKELCKAKEQITRPEPLSAQPELQWLIEVQGGFSGGSSLSETE
ncbi:centrosomal protein of 55 kDa [Cyrtonyx montezumae]|uniref:centrosomal protein of 55 kDa n=1 Tax=Cyrtonyx montezumae TaxID=9017 RepID=UPI0032DB05D9